MNLFLQLQVMISLIFFCVVSLSNALSFNYSSYTGSYDTITVKNERTSVINSQGKIQYTLRVTNADPLHLWDKGSGQLSGFSTYFCFDTLNRTNHADGMAFFLAPNGSRIPDNVTEGGTFGLTSDEKVLNSSDSPFVAVEFDVNSNPWDPPGTHVGVDIDSMRSVASTSWLRSVTNEVWITYNSTSYNLSVEFRGYKNETQETQYLSYMVDLRSWLPQWVTFGFAASIDNDSSVKVRSWSFSSNPMIATKTAKSHQQNKMGKVVGPIAGGCLSVIGLAITWFFLWRKNRRDREREDLFHQYIGQEFSTGTGPKKFFYADLSKATNNFKPERKLGEGGFGCVYSGFLKNTNRYIAVKRISSSSEQGMKEYASEIMTISRLRHRNLVLLLGWCHEKRELLLVYEFLPNRSLDFHLFKVQHLLPWEKRYRIAQGLASALLYLQEEWEQCVVHRDIKSSNVMLDSEFNAKLGDFGLARLVDHAKGARTTILAGTKGYMAPECATTFRATKESDIYSFGIVSLEIACGRKAIDLSAEEDRVVLVEWARELFGKGKILQAADPKLLEEFDEHQMMRLLIVGLWCAHPESRLRPSMKQVFSILDFDAPLPDFPPKFLTATYYEPSMSFAQLYSISSTEVSEAAQQITPIVHSSSKNSS